MTKPSLMLPLLAVFSMPVSAGVLDRIREAAGEAASHPATWAPLLGAAIAAPFDDEVRAWAQDHHPLFDDTKNAAKRSDQLAQALTVVAVASAVVSPVADDATWLEDKGRRLLSYQLARGTTTRVTVMLKEWTNRERPNRSDDESMPSGHTTGAFTKATFAYAEISRFELEPATRWTAAGVLYGLAATTGWARVEADAHWLSDVMVSAAVGNFVARFMHAAVLGNSGMAVEAALTPRGDWSLRLTVPIGVVRP